MFFSVHHTPGKIRSNELRLLFRQSTVALSIPVFHIYRVHTLHEPYHYRPTNEKFAHAQRVLSFFLTSPVATAQGGAFVI